jgi:hypothetical protein
MNKILILLTSLVFFACYSSPHDEKDVLAYIAKNISDSPCIIEKTGKNKWIVFFKNTPDLKFSVNSIGGTSAGIFPSGIYNLEDDYYITCQEYYIKKYYQKRNYCIVKNESIHGWDFINNNQKALLYLRFSFISIDISIENIIDAINEIAFFTTFVKEQPNDPQIIIYCRCINDNAITTYKFDSSINKITEIEPAIIKLLNNEL